MRRLAEQTRWDINKKKAVTKRLALQLMVNYALIDRHSLSYKKMCACQKLNIHNFPWFAWILNGYYSWRGRKKTITKPSKNANAIVLANKFFPPARIDASEIRRFHCNIPINCRSQSDPSSCATRLRFDNIQSMILSNYPIRVILREHWSSPFFFLFWWIFVHIEIKYHLKFTFFFIKYLFLPSQNI